MTQGSTAETSAPADAPRGVMDPALVASIVPRIRRIAQLLQESQFAADQDAEAERPEAMDETEPSAAPAPAASLALGAIADDEDMDEWTQRESRVPTTRVPAALMAQLAHETNALRAAFAASHAAVDAAPGADMSVAEQEALLEQLGAYAAQQEYVLLLTQGRQARLGRRPPQPASGRTYGR